MTRWIVGAAVVAGCAGGGTDECPELGGDPVITSFTVDPTSVTAGDSVDVVVTGEHLGELEESATGATMEMGEEEEHESHCPGGHLHVYLDDLLTNPIAMQEALAFPMTVPAGTEPGEHTLIVRLHNKDHTIYEPQVTLETDLTVE